MIITVKIHSSLVSMGLFDNMLICIGCDFNSALTPLDKTGGTSVERKKTVISEITNLCNTYNLQDVWRVQRPNLSQYTYSLKVQCRLDYWLVLKDLSALVTNSGIPTSTLSDHSTITFSSQSKEYV